MDGLSYAVVELTPEQKATVSKMPGVLIMSQADVIDDKAEEKQLTIRCTNNDIRCSFRRSRSTLHTLPRQVTR